MTSKSHQLLIKVLCRFVFLDARRPRFYSIASSHTHTRTHTQVVMPLSTILLVDLSSIIWWTSRPSIGSKISVEVCCHHT